MRPGLRPASPFARASSALPVLLLAVALAGDPAAAVPRLTYASREFVTSFLPARLFAAGELREGRLALWNPFLLEGAAQAPAVYPADLLLAAWPSPVFASWLLTLHLPLAALAAFALARALGTSATGAFVSGTTYALGGLAVSCLERAAPLPALALAPLVVLLLRGAALHGSRTVLGAAFLLAVALTTLISSIV
ncbi:MAG TPA: hypothetical protein VGB87_08495, partial [Vicinamibacteria bacterium]